MKWPAASELGVRGVERRLALEFAGRSGEICRSDRNRVGPPSSSAERPRSLWLREASGCGEQVDDLLDGLIGAVVGDFETTVGAILRIRTVVEATVGERPAQVLMEEQE